VRRGGDGRADVLTTEPGSVPGRHYCGSPGHANFPPSLHADILARAGLDLEPLEAPAVGKVARRRDPAFRDRILIAYEYRCAMCGFDGWLAGEAIGLDAAHVRWWYIGGPDEVANGLALCTLHHRLFDRGVLGLAVDGTVTVSQLFVGREAGARRLVLDLAGQPALAPQAPHPPIAAQHREWHTAQVFRSPARGAA
jgi:putative restriction endonuclease